MFNQFEIWMKILTLMKTSNKYDSNASICFSKYWKLTQRRSKWQMWSWITKLSSVEKTWKGKLSENKITIIIISSSSVIIIIINANIINYLKKVPRGFPSQPGEELWRTGRGDSLSNSGKVQNSKKRGMGVRPNWNMFHFFSLFFAPSPYNPL